MNFGVKQLKSEFSEHKKNARRFNPQVLPIIIDLENIAIQRATGKMTPKTARSRIKTCCLKVGINPVGLDQEQFKPKIDFNYNRKSNQKSLKLERVNLLALNNKPKSERARRRGLSSLLPAFSPSLKKQQFPAFNLQPKKTKGKVKQFELKPLDFGQNPKKNNFIKPITFEPVGLAKTSFVKNKKKNFLKPIKLGKWF